MAEVLPTGPSGSRSRACDQCNFRKMKCDRVQPCRGCSERRLLCSFNKIHKKKGPAGRKVKALRRSTIRSYAKSLYRRIRELVRQQNTTSESNTDEEQPSSPTDSMDITSMDITSCSQNSPPIWGECLVSAAGPGNRWPSISTRSAPNQLIISEPANSEHRPFIGGANPGYQDFGQEGTAWSFNNPPLYDFDLPWNTLDPLLPLDLEPPADNWASYWPETVSELTLLPIIDMFLNRLHSTIPIFDRNYLHENLLLQHHRQSPHLGAMILALCAFTLIQPIQANERHLVASRVSQAKMLIAEAVKMRATSDFGQSPPLAAVITSFFLFACQYGRGQHNAAWIWLQEAVALGKILRLQDPRSYEGLTGDEKGRRLRTYWLLCITERTYGLQHSHSISFRTSLKESVSRVEDSFSPSNLRLKPPTTKFHLSDTIAENGLQYMIKLLDVIDEDILDCWRDRCNNSEGVCQRLDRQRVIALHRANENFYEQIIQPLARTRFPAATPSWRQGTRTSILGLQEIQEADVLVTQQWLHNRLWQLSLKHNLLSAESDNNELRLGYAITTARTTIEICQGLSLDSMEVHGVGLVAKIYDIASSAARMLVSLRSNEPINSLLDREEPPFCTDCQSQVVGSPYPADGNACLHEHQIPVAQIQETLNQYLAIFALIRGGDHPFLGPYIDLMSTTMRRGNAGSGK